MRNKKEKRQNKDKEIHEKNTTILQYRRNRAKNLRKKKEDTNKEQRTTII